MPLNVCRTVLLSRVGEMYVCGENQFGQLGTGDKKTQPALVKVGFDPFICVSVGELHTVAVTHDGTVWGCGMNHKNILGDLPENHPILVMTPIPNLIDVKSVAVGSYSTALLGNDGIVRILGQITTAGPKIFSIHTVPEILPTPTQIEQISAGRFHYIMLDTLRDVYSYGYGNSYALGHGNSKNQLSPKRIPNLSNIVSISSGEWHNLCLDASGDVYGFGQNFSGQLGLVYSHGNIYTPMKIISDIIRISCGGNYSIFYDSSQDVWMCGDNQYKQLGVDVPSCVRTPKLHQDLKNMEIIPGSEHTFAISPEGNIYSCGRNDVSQCGLPIQIPEDKIAKFSPIPGVSFRSPPRMKSASTRI